jgi:hypothetical protein
VNAAVFEPSAAIVFGTGLATVLLAVRRRRM